MYAALFSLSWSFHSLCISRETLSILRLTISCAWVLILQSIIAQISSLFAVSGMSRGELKSFFFRKDLHLPQNLEARCLVWRLRADLHLEQYDLRTLRTPVLRD